MEPPLYAAEAVADSPQLSPANRVGPLRRRGRCNYIPACRFYIGAPPDADCRKITPLARPDFSACTPRKSFCAHASALRHRVSGTENRISAVASRLAAATAVADRANLRKGSRCKIRGDAVNDHRQAYPGKHSSLPQRSEGATIHLKVASKKSAPMQRIER